MRRRWATILGLACSLAACSREDAGLDRRSEDGGSDRAELADGADLPDTPSSTDGTPADSGSDQLFDQTVTPEQSLLTITKAGTGSGMVTSNPPGISCGADCEQPFDTGSAVVLTASPDTGSSFAGWSGGGCSGTGTCTVSVTAATTVTATFSLNQYALTITQSGNGSGKVTSSPGSINCGTSCSEAFNYGTSVALTASPDTGSSFAGWSGGGCSGTGICTVSATAATTVLATFTLNQYALTVTKSGKGSGNVTSSPVGIACGTSCSQALNYGATVVLTASPDAGSSFAGWSGGGCSGTGTCTVSVTAATMVNAHFFGCTLGPVYACTDGTTPEVNLGTGLTAAQCHDECQSRMVVGGWTPGCWVLTQIGCFCRSGGLLGGATATGGACE